MIGCLIGLIAFFAPRVAIVLLLVFGDWIRACFAALSSPFNGLLIPILGFIFAPYTLLAYCLTWHENNHTVSGMWTVLVVVAALLDLGVIGHGSKSRRKWKERDEK